MTGRAGRAALLVLLAGGLALVGAVPAGTQEIPPEDDVPLPTNPISRSLDDLELESAELDARRGDLDAAEARRDDTIATRDGLRARLVELAADREASVARLADQREVERVRGEERAEAVAVHRRRAAEAKDAGQRLEAAREDLRDLLVDAYMSGSTAVTDAVAAFTEVGELNDSLVRLALGEATLSGQATEVQRRIAEREHDLAVRARALVLRRRAEGAERAATTARVATEAHIVDVDAETVRSIEGEAAARVELERRETALLVALDRVGPARLRADVVGDGLDFQMVAVDAWVKAAAGAPCRLEWWALAGISKVEGRHGTYGGGRLGARGYPSTRIIGPQLDGSGGFARVPDSDDGRYDDDPVYDRAVGPMQFIPSTWARWGRDGDGDGVADPHTFYDATAGAAAYLCAGRTDLTDEAQLRAAYFSYNHSNH